MQNNNMNFGVDLLPIESNSFDLGNNDAKWKSINGISLASLNGNLFFASPNGSAGAPNFRPIASTDLPFATTSAVGAVSISTGLTILNGVLSVSFGSTDGTVAVGNHTHGNISNTGTIGTTNEARAVITNNSNEITIDNFTYSSPNTSGTTTEFIDTISQDSIGKITATKKAIGGTLSNNIGVATTSMPKIFVEDSTSGNGVQASLYIDSGHGNHGLYSNGYYSSSTSTFTSSGKWMIYRNSSGNVIIQGNSDTATKLATAREIYVALGSTRDSNNKITFDGSADKAIHVSGTLPVARGGTGGTTSLAAITNLGGPYILATGTAITSSSNLDTSYNSAGTYYATNSGVSSTLTGTVPVTAAGFKLITCIGYRASTIRLFIGSSNHNLWYRSSLDTGSTWTPWYKFVFLPAGSDNVTFSAVGNATTPVYVSSTGIITAGTALGGAAYKTANYYATSDHTHDYLPLAGGTLNAGAVIYIKDDTLVKGTAPTTTLSVPAILFNDKNGTGTSANRLGMLATYVTSVTSVMSEPAVSTRLFAYKYNTSAATSAYFGAGIYTDTSGNAVKRTYSDCKVYGAVWNDYAEYRKGEIVDGGYCVMETSSGILIKSTKRLLPGCRITSDTFGFAIGETKECLTPIAVSGRVLVYTYRPREKYQLGDAVCSAPDGKVDIMTREEIREYPERIIGIVSEIPDYEVWHCGGDGTENDYVDVQVNNRIWIYVR